MRARDIVGKRVKRIVQVPEPTSSGRRVQHLYYLVFDDDSSLGLTVYEPQIDGNPYVVDGQYYPPEGRR